MNILTKVALPALALGAAFTATPAAANVMIGDTIDCAQVGTGTFSCDFASATVGTGSEFTVGNSNGDFLSFDFDTNSLVLTALRDQDLGATILNFTNAANPFTTALLTSTNGITPDGPGAGGDGFTQGDVTVTNGVLSINLIDTALVDGATATFSFAAVPEPSTWAMLLLGFFGLGAAMRREKKVTTKVAYA
ncbi:PEPxxWA-CTERM sorting domain-containing protein [Erythrobacter sp. W53]|uniref:PEPxxWA-CTERM sorting domain-containing protein n=1 Tax=Erythrobacteraceae TaxID=335929 RepID=UPI0036D2D9BB